jgi:nitroreductase
MAMDVSTAVSNRRSTRAFLDRPVSVERVTTLLEKARRSPSGSNMQPWFVNVVTGGPLATLLDEVRQSMIANPLGEGAEYVLYPENMASRFQQRRQQYGEDKFSLLGIARDDRAARHRDFLRNYQLFGAPVALFFSINRCFAGPQWAHLGMFMQTLMLLAEEDGLATCAQESWSAMYRTVSSFLELPEERILYCGMALGYADISAPVNCLITERAQLAEFAQLSGF